MLRIKKKSLRQDLDNITTNKGIFKIFVLDDQTRRNRGNCLTLPILRRSRVDAL